MEVSGQYGDKVFNLSDNHTFSFVMNKGKQSFLIKLSRGKIETAKS